jgi:hypothetical protein
MTMNATTWTNRVHVALTARLDTVSPDSADYSRLWRALNYLAGRFDREEC